MASVGVVDEFHAKAALIDKNKCGFYARHP